MENEQNNGKFVLIDIETGAWEMDADEMAASRRMDARLPDAQVVRAILADGSEIIKSSPTSMKSTFCGMVSLLPFP